MLNKFHSIAVSVITSSLIALSISGILVGISAFPETIAFADVSPVQVSNIKIGTTTYIVKIQNTSANDIYGIQLVLYGGSNQFGGSTKYIPDLAPGAAVDWTISFITPPNGAVTLQTVIGNNSGTINTIIFY